MTTPEEAEALRDAVVAERVLGGSALRKELTWRFAHSCRDAGYTKVFVRKSDVWAGPCLGGTVLVDLLHKVGAEATRCAPRVKHPSGDRANLSGDEHLIAGELVEAGAVLVTQAGGVLPPARPPRKPLKPRVTPNPNVAYYGRRQWPR
jgi:hypothetical protein